MNKLSFLIRAALAASALAASSAALAQTASVTTIDLGVAAALKSSSNGIVVGVTDTGPYNGNTNYYLTGANGAGLTQISSSPDWSYGGLNGGTTPFGVPNSQESLPTVYAVNSSGQILGQENVFFGTDYQALTGANGSGYTVLPSGSTFNVLSDTGAMAGTSGNNVVYLSSASGSVTTLGSLSGNYAQVSAISSSTNQVAGYFYGNSSSTGFYSAPNGGALTYLTNPNGYVGTQVLSINNSGEVGGSLVYNIGAPVTYTYEAYCGGQAYCGGTYQYLATYTYQQTGNTAFVTDPTNGAIVPIAVGAPGDTTSVEFVNDAGDAIVADDTTGISYLYDGGSVYNLGTLLGTGNINPYNIVGFTSTDEVVVSDPQEYIFTMGQTLTGGTTNNTTSLYTTFEATNTAPTPGFSGLKSNFGEAPAGGGGGGGSSVPAPQNLSLMALALLAGGLFRRKAKIAA